MYCWWINEHRGFPEYYFFQWLIHLLQGFHIHHPQSTLLYKVNKPASAKASNLIHHEKTKHIQLNYHLIREKLHEGHIKIIHVPFEHHIANILTKPLCSLNFHYFIRKIGMINIHFPLEGGCWNVQNHIEDLELELLDS